MTFTIQNTGLTALGPAGGGLGYGPDPPGGAAGIGKSVAIKFDLYDNDGEGDRLHRSLHQWRFAHRSRYRHDQLRHQPAQRRRNFRPHGLQRHHAHHDHHRRRHRRHIHHQLDRQHPLDRRRQHRVRRLHRRHRRPHIQPENRKLDIRQHRHHTSNKPARRSSVPPLAHTPARNPSR